MSNFTKSILYSTTVLAVGLIAIFAIYDLSAVQKVTKSVAALEPAAGEGESDLGINAESMEQSLINIKEQAGQAIQDVKEEVAEIRDALEATDEAAIEKTIEDADLGVADTGKALDQVEPAAGEVVDAAEETISGTIEITEDAVEEAADSALEANETEPSSDTEEEETEE